MTPSLWRVGMHSASVSRRPSIFIDESLLPPTRIFYPQYTTQITIPVNLLTICGELCYNCLVTYYVITTFLGELTSPRPKKATKLSATGDFKWEK